MKERSRAKWPEKMVVAQHEDWQDDLCTYVDDDKGLSQCKIFGMTDTERQSRARQICALPAMVALLKGLAETYMAYKSVDIDFQLDDYYKEAYDICKSIGEVE